MHLAVDGRWLNQKLHGIARYTYEMLFHLPLSRGDQVTVFYNRKEFEPFQKEGFLWVDLNCPLFSPFEGLRISQQLQNRAFDLLWIPSYWRPYRCGLPWIITLHDLIHLEPPMTLKHKLYYSWLKAVLPDAQRILSVSRASVSSLKQWQPQARISYTALAPQTLFASQDIEVLSPGHEDFFLYIGNPKTHKNAALALWLAQTLDFPLRCIGLDPHAYRDLKLSPRITFLDYVSDNELLRHYRTSRGLLFTTLAEGFGLPALEAMACACPVLATDLPVTREVLSHHAQFLPPVALTVAEIKHNLQLFSPERQKPLKLWQAACLELMKKPYKNLAGQTWARSFNWQKSAQSLRQTLNEVLKEIQVPCV